MTLPVSHVENIAFVKNLSSAKITEKEISNLLFQYNGIETIRFSKNKLYDLLVRLPSGKKLTIEIKEDLKCGQTGNMAVEFSSWNRDAGITTSTADCYIHKLHEAGGITYWLTTKEKLLWMIENKLYHRIVNGGDVGSNSMNYLFRLTVFKKYSKELFV